MSLRLKIIYLLGYLWFQGAAVDRSGLQAYCDLIPGLSQNQRETCLTRVDLTQELARGGQLALAECANQFRDERWYCDKDTNMNFSTFFNFWVPEDNREAAYLAAIRSAGFVHRVAAGCNAGNISNCNCGPEEYTGTNERWYWHGCVNALSYAIDLLLGGAHRFLRNEARQDFTPARKFMDSHNYLVGGETVKSLQTKSSNLQCYCHGVSGSCTLKTCWQRLVSFTAVGAELKQKYRSATRVAAVHRQEDNKVPSGKAPAVINTQTQYLVYGSRQPQEPSVNDLIYLQDSPDYCQKYLHSGRYCSNPQVCQHVCCGRHYESMQLVLEEACRCHFHMNVMSVQCNNCTRHSTVYRCE